MARRHRPKPRVPPCRAPCRCPELTVPVADEDRTSPERDSLVFEIIACEFESYSRADRTGSAEEVIVRLRLYPTERVGCGNYATLG